MFKALVENYLENLGYTNIEWLIGNEGWYIVAFDTNSKVTLSIDLRQLANEMVKYC